MTNKNNVDSVAEWADELEKFLECEEYPDKPSRQQKEILLESIAKRMLENPEENEEKTENSLALENESQPCKTSHSRRFLYFVLLCVLSFGLIKYGFCQGKSLKLCWNNSIQDWIYPVLRAIRLTALPVIGYFPSITDIHEETCLVENPLYWDDEVDCTLCQNVGVVTLPHADQFEELFYHRGVPVVVQDAVSAPVPLSALSRLYGQHRDDIVSGSSRRLRPAPPGLADLDQLLGATQDQLVDLPHCVQWRFLRVSAVRHLRQLFERPYFISKKTEVSLHRYIYICGDQGERFSLPMTEFANVWMSQHSGTRQIQLAPSSECDDICRPVSALLRPGETLFFNWRYWRASSLPVDTELLKEADASQADRQEPGDTSGQESQEQERAVSGSSWAAEESALMTSGCGEFLECTEALPAGEQTTMETGASLENSEKTADVRGTKADGWADTCGGAEEAQGSPDGGARAGERDSASEGRTVGITFVGSFY